MKIGLDTRTATSHFPGIGRYVSSLAQAIPAELGAQDSLLFLHDPNLQSRRLGDTHPGKKVLNLPARASPFSLAQQWQIPRLLRQAGASLYHSPYYLMPYRLGIPVVLTVYDLIPLRYPQYVSARARLFYRLTTTLALRVATRIIAISQATQRDFLRTFNLFPEQITTIPLAAGDHFRPQPAAAVNRIRKKYHLPEEFALYIGTNKPHKNLVALLEAWAQFATRNSPEKPILAIAGAWDTRYPQARQHLQQLAIQDSVRFLGPVEEADLPALYCAAHELVFPSLFEGFGLPVLEALACGAPVACSNISSLQEVAGEAAVYFDPQNPEEMSAAIQALWDDKALRQEMRGRGSAQAAQFSWQRTAMETVAIYRLALEAFGKE